MYFTQDLHTHTNLSLCAKPDATAESYLALCAQEGITTLGFANHFWDAQVPGAADWYKKQDFVHVNTLRARMPEELYGVRVLFGCETEYCGHGKVGISRETAKLMDFVLIPTSHTHMKSFTVPATIHTPEEFRQIMIDYTIEVACMGLATGIPHPFCPLDCPDTQTTIAGITDDDFARSFTPCAANGVALEINPDIFNHRMTRDTDGFPKEYRRMYIIARECGCKFFAGCDAHTPKSFLVHDAIRAFARACGIGEEHVFEI